MKLYTLIIAVLCSYTSYAQFTQSDARHWDRYPPEIQKPGFGLHKSQVLQMDDTDELEEVFLFTADNGHYPYFDIFKCYYVIVGYYSKTVKYQSDVQWSISKDLLLEDRNQDGIFELYRKYMKDRQFTVDENGNKLQTQWVYDCIEWK